MPDSIEKKVFSVMIAYFLGGFLLVGAYFNNKTSKSNLGETRKLYGKVLRCGVTARTDSRVGRRESYFIDVGTSFDFKIYRANQDYTDLLKKIKEGDYVLLYYAGPVIYQIEKNDQIIYSFEEASNKKNSFSIILAISGIAIILVGRWYFKKDT